MAPPLEQPRAEGAGSRGRDEDHAALVSSRKRPRAVAETHDDSVAVARAASLRASDYGAWLSESKTRWRSLRKKLALVRNFVKLEANGESLELGAVLDPTGARAREKKRGFSRWKTVLAEEVRVGDIPQLTGDFNRLLAMLKAHPATGGRAAPDAGKERWGDGAGANADADADASPFAFEGERLEDSADDGSISSRGSDGSISNDDDGSVSNEVTEDEDDDRLDRPPPRAEAGARDGTDARPDAASAEPGPERSAADALAAYGDDPPPAFAPPPGGLANAHPAMAVPSSRTTLATLMPPPPPQPQPPRAALGASAPAAMGAAGALAAYGFDETPVFSQTRYASPAAGASGAPGLAPPPSHLRPQAAELMRGARVGAFEDPWRRPAAETAATTETPGSAAAARSNDASSSLPEPRGAAWRSGPDSSRATAPAIALDAGVSGSPTRRGHGNGEKRRRFEMDDDLRAAAALCAKPWMDLSVGDVETVLSQVKYLISRRRRAHKQGRRERRRVRAGAAGAATGAATGAAAAAASTGAARDADASTNPDSPGRLTCVACARVFTLPHQLRDHMHEHAGTAPHRCPFPGCTRAFANRASLSRHKRTHANRHVCARPGCGKSFPSAYALRVHEQSHSDDRPFVCDVPGCGKRFKNEHTLVTHARVHTGEKRFVCGEDGEPGCGKRFGYKVDLKRHRERCSAARGDA